MNRKQIICMWCGIAAITLCSLGHLFVEYLLYGYGLFGCLDMFEDVTNVVVLLFVIATITGGLIITFKDKKDEQKQ